MSFSRVAFTIVLFTSVVGFTDEPSKHNFAGFFHVAENTTEEVSLDSLPQPNSLTKLAKTLANVVQDPLSAIGGPSTGAGVVSAADAKCMQAASEGITTLASDLSMEDLNDIVSIGKQVWELVKTGKPVVDVKRDEIAVLPLRVECWRHLEGWQNPVVKAYRTRIKNLYGMTVVEFTFKVISYPGGSYRGTGKYLARVSVVPVSTYVAPWWEFNASVRVPGVFNYGTVEDPVASVEVEISQSIRTILTHLDQVDNFLIKGNGEILAL